MPVCIWRTTRVGYGRIFELVIVMYYYFNKIKLTQNFCFNLFNTFILVDKEIVRNQLCVILTPSKNIQSEIRTQDISIMLERTLPRNV